MPASSDRCTRCLQPVPVNVRRCPQCGEALLPGERKMSLYLAVIGVVAILLLVVLGLFIINPPTGDADPDRPEKGAPATPAKKPVLD